MLVCNRKGLSFEEKKKKKRTGLSVLNRCQLEKLSFVLALLNRSYLSTLQKIDNSKCCVCSYYFVSCLSWSGEHVFLMSFFFAVHYVLTLYLYVTLKRKTLKPFLYDFIYLFWHYILVILIWSAAAWLQNLVTCQDFINFVVPWLNLYIFSMWYYKAAKLNRFQKQTVYQIRCSFTFINNNF